MEIRKASKFDIDSILAIARCVWIDTYATEGVRQSIAGYVEASFTRSNVLNELDTKEVEVFELKGHLIGYAVLSESDDGTEVEKLYILPKFQGKGFGKQYTHRVLERYERVWLTCWERNTSAIGFYTSLGFQEVGESYFQMDNEHHRNVLFKSGT